jgi:hypothetical protein
MGRGASNLTDALAWESEQIKEKHSDFFVPIEFGGFQEL